MVLRRLRLRQVLNQILVGMRERVCVCERERGSEIEGGGRERAKSRIYSFCCEHRRRI